jgi:hypothetical protein
MKRFSSIRMISLTLFLALSVVSISFAQLQPYVSNKYYWEYNGEPVLLLGAFQGAHNVFVEPDVTSSQFNLTAQMDELVDAGGNMIRAVFDPGWAIHKGFAASHHTVAGEKFDLNLLTSGSNSYWGKFEAMLREARSRDIVVQLEIWDRFDTQKENWINSPFRPANNINYTTSQSGLDDTYFSLNTSPFAHGVPGHPVYEAASSKRKAQLDLVRRFQEKFFDHLLSISLRFDNVLYTMTNETHEDPAWGHYWMARIQDTAASQGKTVYVTDMFDNAWGNLQGSAEYAQVFTVPDSGRYTFLDISQNTATKKVGGAEAHWADLLYARNQLSSNIRPINNTKVYASDETIPSEYRRRVNTRFGDLSAQNSFWMNVIGGSASSRFHRPTAGQGLSDLAKASISAVRKLETKVKLWELEPHNELLSRRGTFTANFPGIDFDNEPFVYGEAFLTADPGEKYALYFTQGGSVGLNLNAYTNAVFTLDWINIENGQWGSSSTILGGSTVPITPPDSGPWVAAIVRNK